MNIALLIAGILFLNQACLAHNQDNNQSMHHENQVNHTSKAAPGNHGPQGNHAKIKSQVKKSVNYVERSHNFISKPPKPSKNPQHKSINFDEFSVEIDSSDNSSDVDTRAPSQIIGAPVGPTGVTTLTMESDLHVTSTVEFIGDTAINGNGSILYLDAGGSLQIDADSTLTIKNVTIKGVGGQNIFCVDNTGSLIVQNVRWIQTSDFTFSQGSFDVANDFHCIGNGLSFIYNTTQPCTINTGSEMKLDYNFTFKYIPGSDNLFVFADSSSTLSLAGGTLHVGAEGLAIQKGLVFVDGQSTFESEGVITIGDGTSPNDTIFVFGAAAILSLTSGSLFYNNALETSWNMRDTNAILKIYPDTTLDLFKTLNLDLGSLLISTTANLFTEPGASLVGNVSFF